MIVQIDIATLGTPTWTTNITSCKWSLDDAQSGTTPIPTPTATGTNFSFVKSFKVDITNVGASLTMTNVKIGTTTSPATGLKLWHQKHTTYTQATAAPTSTGDNNSTAPTINGTAAVAGGMVLIGSAAVLLAGPFTTTGRQGDHIEVCLGVDNGNTGSGSTVAVPTLRFQWTEA